MGIREERKAATQRGIHLATLDLLEASGLEVTTVAQIAERAGISERTFFRYYDSKESAALPGQGELAEALVSLPLGKTSTPAQVLEELIDVCREHFAREVEQHEFLRISRLLLAEPRLLQVVTRQELELVALLGGSLVQRGLLDPLRAQLAAEMIVCTWRVAWQRFAQEARAGKTSNPTEFFEEAVAALAELTPGRTGQRRR